ERITIFIFNTPGVLSRIIIKQNLEGGYLSAAESIKITGSYISGRNIVRFTIYRKDFNFISVVSRYGIYHLQINLNGRKHFNVSRPVYLLRSFPIHYNF